jgi:hypothetical protein
MIKFYLKKFRPIELRDWKERVYMYLKQYIVVRNTVPNIRIVVISNNEAEVPSGKFREGNDSMEYAVAVIHFTKVSVEVLYYHFFP